MQKPENCLQRLQQRALQLLAQREHSQQELLKKLTQRLPDCAAQVEACLLSLEQAGWLSEVRFTEAFLRKEVRLGHGELKVRQGLKQKGVDIELINAVLQASEVDWLALAQQVRQKKFGDDVPSDMKELARQNRFLLYRGFDQNTIRQVLKPIEY